MLVPCTFYEVLVKVETEEAGVGDPVNTNLTTICKGNIILTLCCLWNQTSQSFNS